VKKNVTMLITSVSLCAALALPVRPQGNATQPHSAPHHHYKLVDMGTRGGPNSFSTFPLSLDINTRGLAVAQADTSIPDPYAPNCFLTPDCLVTHVITWQNGVQTDLGALPGGYNSSAPLWINEQGSVAGVSENGVIDPLTGFPETSAVLWKDGKILDLGTLGGNASFADAINNRGQVVGGALNTIPDSDANGLTLGHFPPFLFPVATQNRAFLWRHGVMHDLGTLGTGNDAVALFVNDLGQVSGVSFTNTTPNATTGNPTQDPFFWEDGKMVDIGTLGGTQGVPYWMNNRGQVVGYSTEVTDQNSHAFLWDKEKGLKDLGFLPGGTYGNAEGINDAGEVVGGSDSSSGFHAFLWGKGVMTDLGNLAGDCSSQATSINSRGQIVGNGSIDCNNEAHAILFENGGTPTDLNTLVPPGSTVTVLNAFNINDRGEIAGYGVLPNGDARAVLLIPCDEDHPDIEGCDYDTVEAVTEAPVRSAQTTTAPAAASATKLPPTELARFRSLMAGRNRRFGTSKTSPK
jgi:probable HAF family extracellular repeat protein